jgi:dipeptidyl aminopeptidase/acylaminoacyl peptidase
MAVEGYFLSILRILTRTARRSWPIGPWALNSSVRGSVRSAPSAWPHDADGGNVRVVARDPGGSMLGFWRPERSDIWVIDLASGAATNLTPDRRSMADETPSWSPDGKTIVFQSTRSGRFEVWRMNADGSAPVQLTH